MGWHRIPAGWRCHAAALPRQGNRQTPWANGLGPRRDLIAPSSAAPAESAQLKLDASANLCKLNAVVELYNPAQVDVFARAGVLARDLLSAEQERILDVIRQKCVKRKRMPVFA